MLDEKIYLVPIGKKYAQFKFRPAERMTELLNEYKIPYKFNESGILPLGAKSINKTARPQSILIQYRIKRNNKTKEDQREFYTFSFASNIIDKILDYYKVPYVKESTEKRVIKKETNKDMFNYKGKQTKAKLENWYICKELEIKYNTWQDIKKGKRSLARKKLDRFLELVDPAKQTWLEQESEKQKIDAWFKENKANISEMINDFGVNNVMIASDLGVDNSTISNIRNGKGDTLQAVYLLYYYLNDDNNRRHTSIRKKSGRKPGRKPSVTVIKKVIPIPTKEMTTEEIAEKIVNHEPDNRDILIDKLENQVEGLKYTNDKLNEELARYKYLIDLAMQNQNRTI